MAIEKPGAIISNAEIELVPTPKRVRVRFGRERGAESDRAASLFEKDHLPVYYFAWGDVRHVLEASATRTRCPYKGEARHFHVDAGGTRHEDICWTYPIARLEAARVEGMIGFYQERVDRLLIDGVEQEKPTTRWS